MTVNISMPSDLSEFTSIVSADGDLSWTSSGLAGTTGGMQVVINDTDNQYGVVALSSPASGIIRGRFYFDANSFTNTSAQIALINIRTSSTPSNILSIVCRNHASVPYIIEIYVYEDGGGGINAAQAISVSDAPHYFEFKLTRATNSTSDNGTAQLWIDGTSIGSVSNIDNYDIWTSINAVWIGTLSKNYANIGTIYLDELVVNDDGSVIGPVAVVTFSPAWAGNRNTIVEV